MFSSEGRAAGEGSGVICNEKLSGSITRKRRRLCNQKTVLNGRVCERRCKRDGRLPVRHVLEFRIRD